MGFMHRVKVMLGLADDYDDEYYDEEYADDVDVDDEEPAAAPAASYRSPYGTEPTSVRRIGREPDLDRAREAAPVRSVPVGSTAMPPAASGPAASGGPQVRIHAVEPRNYAEAPSIADKFKAGQPVILNLTATDAEQAKRLLDFASGLTYGLEGGLQKVSDKVFMLTPRNVDVSAADKVRLRDKGVFGIEP